MDFQELQKRYRAAKLRNVVFLSTTVLLLSVDVLLTLKLYNTSNQVALVPTTVRDGMVARGAYDKSYIEAIAKDAVYGLYNTSPNTLEYGRQIIERVSSVAHRQRLLKLYDEVAEDIRARGISTYFSPETIEHNLNDKSVVVKGRFQTMLDNVLATTERRWIRVEFIEEAGSARLAKISNLEVTE
jgi:conjugal transfer pilus assembly protein TraE